LSNKAQTPEKKSFAFTKGSWELNFSGDMGSMSSTTKNESAGYSSEYSSDHTYFQLHLIPGYFLIDGLSFEPELDFLFVEDSKPSYSLIPILSYTYLIPSNPNLAIYVRGGYGLTNSYNYFGALLRQSSDLDIEVINVGAGIKILATENFCIRTEINYRRSSNTEGNPTNNPSYSITQTLSNIRVLFGLSLLL
jgi:hypothetical protein